MAGGVSMAGWVGRGNFNEWILQSFDFGILGKSKMCNLSNARLEPEDNYSALKIELKYQS